MSRTLNGADALEMQALLRKKRGYPARATRRDGSPGKGFTLEAVRVERDGTLDVDVAKVIIDDARDGKLSQRERSRIAELRESAAEPSTRLAP